MDKTLKIYLQGIIDVCVKIRVLEKKETFKNIPTVRIHCWGILFQGFAIKFLKKIISEDT